MDQLPVSSDERGSSLQWFGEFVTASRWRFAKTFVETYPHEYTLMKWVPAEGFARAIDCIERWGVVESFCWRGRARGEAQAEVSQ